MKNKTLSLNYLIILIIILQFAIFSYANGDNFNYNKTDFEGCTEVYDPYEKLNRKIFVFNSVLDHFLLRPVALGYDRVLNVYVKARITNFIDNITYPTTIVNYGLQGQGRKILGSFWRFVVNSTFGLGGLFDVASKKGLNSDTQTIGQTLGYYGVGPGPYLVIPFLGSSSARDMSETLFANDVMNPVKYYMHKDFKSGITIVKLVNDRAMIMPFTDHITQTALDPYVAIRSAVHQKRESKVNYPKGFICPTIKR